MSNYSTQQATSQPFRVNLNCLTRTKPNRAVQATVTGGSTRAGRNVQPSGQMRAVARRPGRQAGGRAHAGMPLTKPGAIGGDWAFWTGAAGSTWPKKYQAGSLNYGRPEG